MGDVIQFVSNAEYEAMTDAMCRMCAGTIDTEQLISKCDHLCAFWHYRPFKDGHEMGTGPYPSHERQTRRQNGSRWQGEEWRDGVATSDGPETNGNGPSVDS